MPLPDDFSPAAFARAHGDPAYDRAVDAADAAVARDQVRAVTLRAALNTLLGVIDEMEFETAFPVSGYGMDDLRDMTTAIRDGISLPEYRVRARAVAVGLALGGDL